MNLSNPESPRVKITAVGDQLTTSERRVVMTLLSNYPEAGLTHSRVICRVGQGQSTYHNSLCKKARL